MIQVLHDLALPGEFPGSDIGFVAAAVKA